MADLRGQELRDSYQNVVTDSGSDLNGIQNGNGVGITARIVSRGSNSNGEWVRFADGTQICLRDYSAGGSTNTETIQGLTVYRSSAVLVNLANNFSNTNYHYSLQNVDNGADRRLIHLKTRTSETTTSAVEIQWIGLQDPNSVDIKIIAIGDWK